MRVSIQYVRLTAGAMGDRGTGVPGTGGIGSCQPLVVVLRTAFGSSSGAARVLNFQATFLDLVYNYFLCKTQAIHPWSHFFNGTKVLHNYNFKHKVKEKIRGSVNTFTFKFTFTFK